MDALSLGKIAEFAGADLFGGNAETQVQRVSTDSRTIRDGDLFVALRGDNFDAHDVVAQVAEAGAIAAMVNSDWAGVAPEKFPLLRVDDTLVGYQQLAANYRRSLPLKVICITGSNGK